jgi:segregation and condensation protein A
VGPRRTVRVLPEITLKEMLIAFRDVAVRTEMFAHHHIHREPLSVRARMSDVLAALRSDTFVEFASLFHPEEGRMGVAVTFIAILELMREGLIEIAQTEAFAPIHMRAADPARTGHVIDGAAAEVAAEDARLLEQRIDEHADDEEPLE